MAIGSNQLGCDTSGFAAFPNLKYTGEQFAAAGKIALETPYIIFSTFNRIKSDSNAFGKLLSLSACGMDLYQQTRKVKSLNTAVRLFGTVGALYDAFQITGTIHYLGKKLALHLEKGKANGELAVLNEEDNESNLDCLTEISFGVANFGEALLWANSTNLIDLGKFTIQSIGGVAVGSLSLVGVVTAGALVGFVGMTASAGLNFHNLGFDHIYTSEGKSDLCSLAWTVTEIALIVIPAVGFAPATSWLIAGKIVAKSAGIAAFLYK